MKKIKIGDVEISIEAMEIEASNDERIMELKSQMLTSNEPAVRVAARMASSELLSCFKACLEAEQKRGTEVDDAMNGILMFVGSIIAATFRGMKIDNADGEAAKRAAKQIMKTINLGRDME